MVIDRVCTCWFRAILAKDLHPDVCIHVTKTNYNEMQGFSIYVTSSSISSLMYGYCGEIFVFLFGFDLMQVAIKTLIVFHRTLRESDPSFREEFVNYSRRGQVFLISNFKDDSSSLGT